VSRRNTDFGDDAATALVYALVAGALLLGIAMVAGAITLIGWVVSVYAEQGGRGSKAAPALWASLIAFFIVISSCILVATTDPGSLNSVLVAGGIAAGLYFLVVAVCGNTGEPVGHGTQQLPEDLEAYLDFDRGSVPSWWDKDAV
jgi:hypothetical protein